jgi:hypothetical protein
LKIYYSLLDEPPPAYEITSLSNNHENIDVAAAVEAPPPYCLVDPSKIRNTDHIPRHPHISPVEVIDLNVNEPVKINNNISSKIYILFS